MFEIFSKIKRIYHLFSKILRIMKYIFKVIIYILKNSNPIFVYYLNSQNCRSISHNISYISYNPISFFAPPPKFYFWGAKMKFDPPAAE